MRSPMTLAGRVSRAEGRPSDADPLAYAALRRKASGASPQNIAAPSLPDPAPLPSDG